MEKEKFLLYKYDDMARAGRLFNAISATGTTNFRILAQIADILDSGKIVPASEVKSKDGSCERE